MRPVLLALAAALPLALAPALPRATAAAEDAAVARWRAEKCARYAAAWPEALALVGRDRPGEAFLAAHAAFLASGCRTGREICPRSAAERELADLMTVAAMNAGAASTFPPFRCRG
jgi:hypothetical protein